MSKSSKAEGPNLIRNGGFEYDFQLWEAASNVHVGAHESGNKRAEFRTGDVTHGILIQLVPEFRQSGTFRVSFRMAAERTPTPGPRTLHIHVGDLEFLESIQPGSSMTWSQDVLLPQDNYSTALMFQTDYDAPSTAMLWIDDVTVKEVLADPLIKNGDFSANGDYWTLIDAKVEYGHAILEPLIEGSVGQDVTLPGPGKYLLTFDVSSSKDEPRYGEIDIVGKGQDPKHQLIWYAIRGTEPNLVACVFDTETVGLTNDISIAIATHHAHAETFIDNVTLVKL